MVYEYGEEEGMRMMEELSLEDDANSVVFQGGVVQEPKVCLALGELIPVNNVRQACEAPELAKSVQILFCGQHGLGVWKLAAEQSLAERYSGGKLVGRLEGYLATVGEKILDSAVQVSSLGLGHMSEMVFHRRLLGGSFGGVVKGLPGTGEWRCSNCGKADCWSTRYSCCRCGVPRYFDGSSFVQGHFSGGGMSGVRLVGALGRDQTYVSARNPTYRKGSGWRGGGREGPSLVRSGSGGNRVGDVLVMGGVAQSEYQHRTVSGLQSPRVNQRIQRMLVGLVCLVVLGRRFLALLRWVRVGRRGNLFLEAPKALLGRRSGDSGGGSDSGAHSPISTGHSPQALRLN